MQHVNSHRISTPKENEIADKFAAADRLLPPHEARISKIPRGDWYKTTDLWSETLARDIVETWPHTLIPVALPSTGIPDNSPIILPVPDTPQPVRKFGKPPSK